VTLAFFAAIKSMLFVPVAVMQMSFNLGARSKQDWSITCLLVINMVASFIRSIFRHKKTGAEAPVSITT